MLFPTNLAQKLPGALDLAWEKNSIPQGIEIGTAAKPQLPIVASDFLIFFHLAHINPSFQSVAPHYVRAMHKANPLVIQSYCISPRDAINMVFFLALIPGYGGGFGNSFNFLR